MDRSRQPSPLSDEAPVHFSREVMNAQEAADFLRLSYDAFRKLAPSLPRHRLSGGYRYLRADLLAYLTCGNRRQPDGNAGTQSGTQGHKQGRKGRVVRLV